MTGQRSPLNPTVELTDGIKALAARIAELERAQSVVGATTVTTGFTAATGFALTNTHATRTGNVVTWKAFVERTGADIAVPADGNISDTHILTLPSTVNGNHSHDQPVHGLGRVMAGWKNSSGQVYAASTTPGRDWRTADIWRVGGTYQFDE